MTKKELSNQRVLKSLFIGLATIVIGALLSVSLLPSKAHATSCGKEYVSLELAYLSSDVIFTGYPIKNEETGESEWGVTELFKGEFNEDLKPYDESQKAKLESEIERLYFGMYYPRSSNNLQISPCSRSKIPVDRYVERLKSGSISEDKIGKRVKLIIKGKAVRKTVESYARTFPENTPEEYKKRPHKPIVKAMVDFEILDVLQNKTELFQTELEPQRQQVSVVVDYCEKGYEIGGEYLLLIEEVSKSLQKRREHQGKEALPRFFTRCLPYRGTWSFGEIESLREFKLFNTGR